MTPLDFRPDGATFQPATDVAQRYGCTCHAMPSTWAWEPTRRHATWVPVPTGGLDAIPDLKDVGEAFRTIEVCPLHGRNAALLARESRPLEVGR